MLHTMTRLAQFSQQAYVHTVLLGLRLWDALSYYVFIVVVTLTPNWRNMGSSQFSVHFGSTDLSHLG